MLGVTACGVMPTARPPAAQCDFPDDVALSFAEETTLGDVGLAAPGGESLRAYVWITAEPVRTADGAMQRAICADGLDGTFIVSPYPPPSVPNEGG